MLKELLLVFNVQPFSTNFPNSFNGNTTTRTLLLINNVQQGFEVQITPTQSDYREPYDYPFQIKLYGVIGYRLQFNLFESYYAPNFNQIGMAIEFEGEDDSFEKKHTNIIAVYEKYGVKVK